MLEWLDDLDDRPGRDPACDADHEGIKIAFGEFFYGALRLFTFRIIADRRGFHQFYSAFSEFIRSRAAEVLQKAASLLAEIEQNGLFATLEKGVFADIKRPQDGGKGLEGVVRKSERYFNPFIEEMRRKEAAK